MPTYLTTRLQELGRAAYQRALDLKLGALEAAKARIDVEFGPRNSASQRLAHQMLELGPSHPVVRFQYRKFALALEPLHSDGLHYDPIGLDEALIVYRSALRLCRAEAANEDFSLFQRQDAALRAVRYKSLLLVLRYMRAHHVTPLRFESIRQTVCHGARHALSIEGRSL